MTGAVIFWHVWAASSIVLIGCWGIGRSLVHSTKPHAMLLGGWCAFLVLCVFTWFAGFPAAHVRPLFWTFFAIGGGLCLRDRQWDVLICAALCALALSLLLCTPYLKYPTIFAYGAHGTDMWGYVNTGEWLRGHSIRELPTPGMPMRFNWVWHVLTTRERPLIYELLACIGSSTGISPVEAYVALPSVLLASLAMGICRQTKAFGFRHWVIAFLPALFVAVHPLVVLHWIAQYVGGAVVSCFVTMAFAAFVVAENDRSLPETSACAVMMLIFCCGLYAGQFLLIGAALAVAILAAHVASVLRTYGFKGLAKQHLETRAALLLIVCAVLGAGTFVLSGDLLPGISTVERTSDPVAQVLEIFGGFDPYFWYGYAGPGPTHYVPEPNPVGAASAFAMAVLFAACAWARWKKDRDVRLPFIIGISAGCLIIAVRMNFEVLTRMIPIFGVALFMLLASISGEFRSLLPRLACIALCCMPFVRSAGKIQEMLIHPYISLDIMERTAPEDGDDWRIMCYLHYFEETRGFDWSSNPRIYRSFTHFLPEAIRKQVAERQKIHAMPNAQLREESGELKSFDKKSDDNEKVSGSNELTSVDGVSPEARDRAKTRDRAEEKRAVASNALLFPLFGLVLLCEALSVIVRIFPSRFRRKKIFIRSPVHRNLRALGWTNATTVFRFWTITGMMAFLVLLLFFLLGFGNSGLGWNL